MPGRDTNRRALQAVIFDLDGVVADSHPIHEIAWTRLFLERGLDRAKLNLDFLYAGHPRRAILRHYLGDLDVSDLETLGRRKDQLYAEAATQLQPKPRIPEVIRQLNGDGIVCALATSAGRQRTYETLERFGLIGEFAAIVTGEETDTPKPAPVIFLLAAARVRTEPEGCVVVEDSVAGVAAARAAGMKCVGFAPAKWFAELSEAGADDLISELPGDATGYFRALAGRKEPAERARV
ncbi:MAG TPA: HAD family phosphatase [Candidatus Acidoferrum sp.]|nr:HAD family phosphatase [Candidatus Acidoferrum sp.]